MTRTLTRPCLNCGKQVRGKPRCRDCTAAMARAKAAKRPDRKTYAEAERRRRLVADHRAEVGDWCPGLEDHPAHPSADLVADHVVEVAISGLETGPLRVLCRRENGRRSARILDKVLNHAPSPAEQPITHGGGRPLSAPAQIEHLPRGSRESRPQSSRRRVPSTPARLQAARVGGVAVLDRLHPGSPRPRRP